MRLWCVGGPAASAAAAALMPGPAASVSGLAGSVMVAGREKVSSTMRETKELVIASYAGRIEARIPLSAPRDSRSSRHSLHGNQIAENSILRCLILLRELWRSRMALQYALESLIFVCLHFGGGCCWACWVLLSKAQVPLQTRLLH